MLHFKLSYIKHSVSNSSVKQPAIDFQDILSGLWAKKSFPSAEIDENNISSLVNHITKFLFLTSKGTQRLNIENTLNG